MYTSSCDHVTLPAPTDVSFEQHHHVPTQSLDQCIPRPAARVYKKLQQLLKLTLIDLTIVGSCLNRLNNGLKGV